MPRDEEGNEKYPYQYRGAGAIHLTGLRHYEAFADEIKKLQGVYDLNIMCPSNDIEEIKIKGCNYVAFQYPWEVATFYFDWKTSSDKNLIQICLESKEQDNQDYRQDCIARPQVSLEDLNAAYQSTVLFESVRSLTIIIRGGDDHQPITDGGSVAKRKFYYRLCRDILFPLTNLSSEEESI